MGVYEIITGITKNEENLKVEIRQTEGTLERNLVKDRMSQFYEIEDTEFWKQVKEIDSKPMTDRQIEKALSKARETLKIVVDAEALKKTIKSMINKKDYSDNDTHIDLNNTTDKELKAIEICFREQED